MLTPIQKRHIWADQLHAANKRRKVMKNGSDTPTRAYNRALKEAGLKRGSLPDQLEEKCRQYGVLISPELAEAFEEYDEELAAAKRAP